MRFTYVEVGGVMRAVPVAEPQITPLPVVRVTRERRRVLSPYTKRWRGAKCRCGRRHFCRGKCRPCFMKAYNAGRREEMRAYNAARPGRARGGRVFRP